MKEKTKVKKWIRFRHRVVRNIAYMVLAPYSRLVYGMKVERFRGQEDRPYLILLNHQTAFDQFFVGMAFRGAVYYLASEDLFSNGWVSSLIRYLVAPIPIKKQATDVRAILNCMRVAKEGGTIAIAPEGNRTYSGKTEYINPSIVPLVRKLDMPVALYRIEGGYGTQPRWSDVVRRGKMRGYVSRVIPPEEYRTLTDEALFALIRDGLYVNEAAVTGTYNHLRLAEYLERALYVCPYCGLSIFESHRDLVQCRTCGRKIRYTPTKELQGVGFNFPFRFVADWYDYQSDFINQLDVTAYTDTPLYTDMAALSEVVPYQKKRPIASDATLRLFGDRVRIEYAGESMTLPFEKVTAVAVLGRNKLNLYHEGHIYQIKSNKRFNALKYVHIYHRWKNITKGERYGQFLGL